MYHLVGKKEIFAIEMEISQDKWRNKTAIWINNLRIGDWEDENLLAPFIRSLYRIAFKNEDFWLDELRGLDCYQTYLTIYPFYNNSDAFYDLPKEEREQMERFDKFLLVWGENFDSWGLTMVYKDGICRFLWVHSPLGENDTFEVKNNIQCYGVKLEFVQEAYSELQKIIPDEIWRPLIPIFFENLFTEYLLNNGWKQVGPMSFKNNITEIEIFFDNTNQIEMYGKEGWIKNAYINKLEDLIEELGAVSK